MSQRFLREFSGCQGLCGVVQNFVGFRRVLWVYMQGFQVFVEGICKSFYKNLVYRLRGLRLGIGMSRVACRL